MTYNDIQYHINGSYLKDYLQHCHHWSKSVWNWIDMRAFGRHFKQTITTHAHRPAHLQFVRNQLPLGDIKYRCSAVKDPTLTACPCCLSANEGQINFLQCQQNTARATALAALLKTILTDLHPSRPAYAACLESFLQNPHQPVNLELPAREFSPESSSTSQPGATSFSTSHAGKTRPGNPNANPHRLDASNAGFHFEPLKYTCCHVPFR